MASPGPTPAGCWPWSARRWSRGNRRRTVVDSLAAAADPAPAHRFEVVHRAVVGDVVELRTPLVVDGAPTTTRRPAPTFDQHSDEVLREVAGYDAERIAALRAAGVVGGQLPDPATAGW